MLIHLINAHKPAKKSSIKKNIFLNLLLGIVDKPEKKLNIELQRRLTIAVESLQHQKLDNRIIGICSLEQITQEYPQYQREIIDIFTAFVRRNASQLAQEDFKGMLLHEIRPDIH